jgi:hypothetical protein
MRVCELQSQSVLCGIQKKFLPVLRIRPSPSLYQLSYPVSSKVPFLNILDLKTLRSLNFQKKYWSTQNFKQTLLHFNRFINSDNNIFHGIQKVSNIVAFHNPFTRDCAVRNIWIWSHETDIRMMWHPTKEVEGFGKSSLSEGEGGC